MPVGAGRRVGFWIGQDKSHHSTVGDMQHSTLEISPPRNIFYSNFELLKN